MKIFITGVRGFLGANLREAMQARGHSVIGSSSQPGEASLWKIGDPFDPRMLAGADALIHCAHSFRRGELERNVAAARQVFHAAQGLRRIFLSSHSARADAAGEYGVAKYRIERFWLEGGGTVVRPGLVLGPGGVFGRYLGALRKLSLVPLIDGGRDRVPVITLAEFREAMARLLETGDKPEYNLFEQAMPEMRELVRKIAASENRHARLLSVPWGVARATAQLLESFGVTAPFSSDSLRMLRVNRTQVHVSNLRELLPSDSESARNAPHPLPAAESD